ncbi:uncharacterized protein LOC142357360 isoform X2 [Convolutriloba macropyga]|uniref:uncharacterized protein LOC142357360 isoform X2 n=1 Tax=Convolutriloba macropyga TaxID=536237 RepID=UPI003F521578
MEQNSLSSHSKYKVEYPIEDYETRKETREKKTSSKDHKSHYESTGFSSRPTSSGESRNVATPVFNSFCERSSSVERRTMCMSPSYNLSTDFETSSRNVVQTTESSAQTILTMDLFSTNRVPEYKKRSASPFRVRGKSQSPRSPAVVSGAQKPRAESNTSKTERSLKESGENLKRLLIRKLTPWRKSSTSVGTSPRHSEIKEDCVAIAAEGDHEVSLNGNLQNISPKLTV